MIIKYKYGEAAFKNCTNLHSIPLSPQMTCIESETFAGCKNLRRLYIPSSIRRIEADFCKGSAIKYLNFGNPYSPPRLEGDVTLKDYYLRFIAIVPDGSRDNYYNYPTWRLFKIRESGDIITKSKKIHIDQAGTLSNILDSDTARKLTEVVITGELNLNDFLYLRQAAGCIVKSGGDVVWGKGILRNIDLNNAKLIDDGNFSYDFVGIVMGQPQQTSLMKQFSLKLTKINVRFMYQKAQ
uniref:leucine-rich repeat protein n=1 Tax=Segatella hominis TaxID=2518605 RepID=UPI0040387C7A